MNSLLLRVRAHAAVAGLATALLLGSACSSYRETVGADAQQNYINHAQSTKDRFLAKDQTLKRFFEHSYAYVIFPEITKGAAGIGGAHGDGGVAYEKGQVAGFAEVTQATIGLQLGGQEFAEIIFFEDQPTFWEFKRGNLEFSANASAVAAASGAGASADYTRGVAVFTMPMGGLMFEASIGGQKFAYYPKDQYPEAVARANE